MTMERIEQLTRAYASARDVLSGRMNDLEDEVRKIRRRRLPGIRAAVAGVAEAESKLRAVISSNQDLFKRPRTRLFHGIKVGLQKGKGGLKWHSDEQVVSLIRKHFPDDFAVLVKVTEKPLKAPLSKLEVGELKKLGITVVDTGDQVLIKSTDSEIDKLVTALLEDESLDEDQVKSA